MINEKDYFKIIKGLPVHRCEGYINEEIIKGSGILDQPQKNKTSFLTHVVYSVAFISIISFLFGASTQHINKSKDHNLLLASNTKILLNQVVQGTYKVFIGQ